MVFIGVTFNKTRKYFPEDLSIQRELILFEYSILNTHRLPYSIKKYGKFDSMLQSCGCLLTFQKTFSIILVLDLYMYMFVFSALKFYIYFAVATVDLYN